MSDYQSLNGDSRKNQKSPVTYAFFGAVVMCAVWLIIYYAALKEDSSSCDTAAPYDPSAYQTSDQYYATQPVHGFTVNDNMRVERLSDPVLSPDGTMILLSRKQYQMPDSKASTTTISIQALKAGETWLDTTSTPYQLTRPEWGIADFTPAWSPDGTVITFLSNRGTSGTTQIWQISTNDAINMMNKGTQAYGSTLTAVTSYPIDVDNYLWSPDGLKIAFSSQVYTNMTMAQTVQQRQSIADSGMNYLVFDKLFVRHWDTFRDGTRNNPFITAVAKQSSGLYLATGSPTNVMGTNDADAPTKPYGDQTEWSWSHDGSKFAFTRRHDETSEVAFSTNLDVYVYTYGSTQNGGICQTCGNQATDTSPRFHPTDSNTLVYRSMATREYESDRLRVRLANTNSIDNYTELTGDWTFSIDDVQWSRDGTNLWISLLIDGDQRIQKISSTQPTAADSGTNIVADGNAGIPQEAVNQSTILYSYSRWTSPINVYASSALTATAANQLKQITTYNDVLLSKSETTPGAKFYFEGSNNDTVAGWIFQPVGFVNDGTQYPVAFLIHGGPQGAWEQSWSYRWNPQVYTGAGFAVVVVNFHGSTGYGQDFVDSITGRYGSWPYDDLIKGLNHTLETYPWLDANRVAGLGASYGGYMVNWIAGSDGADMFKCLVTHDGMFDMNSFYYSTEELWFPEHDMEGLPYVHPVNYAEWNPSDPNRIIKWHLPHLIIHGGIDYRISDAQGLSAFTALQRQGIPSKFLYFPTENHWVLNARNQIQWHTTVLDWITTYTPPAPPV